MGLLDKLSRVGSQGLSETFNNTSDRISSEIPNITSGLDIADNGIVKDLITDGINSIFRSGEIRRSADVVNISGPSHMDPVKQSTAEYQFIKLKTLKETFISDPAATAGNQQVYRQTGSLASTTSRPTATGTTSGLVASAVESVENFFSDSDERVPEAKQSLAHKTVKTEERTFILPFPQDVQIQTSPQWSGKAGGVLGELILNNKIDLSGTYGDIAANASDALGRVGEAASANARRTGADLLGAFTTGTSDVGQFIEAANGKLLNPRNVVLFDGIEHRTFSITFNFAPTSERATKEILDFLVEIHEQATPDVKGAYFTYPEFFTFAIVNEKNETILDRGEVVITDLNCNYTPDGVWATFKNGQPVHIELAVTFQERTLPTRDTVKRLFGKDK